jgi:hypothetical protein
VEIDSGVARASLIVELLGLWNEPIRRDVRIVRRQNGNEESETGVSYCLGGDQEFGRSWGDVIYRAARSGCTARPNTVSCQKIPGLLRSMVTINNKKAIR